MVGLVAVLIAIPSTASAKEIVEVTVHDEEGTAHTLVGERAARDLADSTHVYSAAFRTDPRLILTDAPSGDLGPRFSLLWDLGFGVPIRQDAYPLAEDGPVTFVPPDQPLGEDATSPVNRTFGGWFRADAGLVDAFESMGFPLEPEGGGVALGRSTIALAIAVLTFALLAMTAALRKARPTGAVVPAVVDD